MVPSFIQQKQSGRLFCQQLSTLSTHLVDDERGGAHSVISAGNRSLGKDFADSGCFLTTELPLDVRAWSWACSYFGAFGRT